MMAHGGDAKLRQLLERGQVRRRGPAAFVG
jgi:hypothetical protein